MTWYFQYVLARDIAAAREAEASRSNIARLAKARSDEDRPDGGLRRLATARRGRIAAAVASLARQTQSVARRLGVDSATGFDGASGSRIHCDGEADGA